jgi:hypothetical protein
MFRSDMSPFVFFGFFHFDQCSMVLPIFEVGTTELLQANRTTS